MRSIRFQRLARLGTGAILLLLVQGLAAPGSAWAGCTHLVTSRSDPYKNLARLDGLFVDGSAPQVMGTSIESPLNIPAAPARQLPCSGLTCSSRDSVPGSTVATESDDSDQWGTLITELVPELARSPVSADGDPAPRSEIAKTSIFHPPRV